MFNPIIPVCSTLPAAWRQAHFEAITGKGLVDAYIKFFEPDVFVEAEAGLAKEAGIADTQRFLSERVISTKQFVRDGGRRRPDFAFGLSVLGAYNELYKEEFQFVSRRPRKVAVFQDNDPYCEAVFGAFAHSKKLIHIKRAYSEVFGPETVSATAEDCLKLIKGSHLTPLSAGIYKLDVNFENRDDPTIFVCDPSKIVDLIDFWNLRQFRSHLLPINVHWFKQFAGVVRNVITSNFRPLPGNQHGVMITTTLEFGRSIAKATKDMPHD